MAFDSAQTINSIGTRLEIDIAKQFQSAVARGLRGAVGEVLKAHQVLASKIGDPADLERVHTQLAHDAQEAILVAYDDTVEGEKKVESYRIGQNRYAGGMLRRALESPSMVVATAKGIDYIDQDILNTQARHWQRLNFGAGAAGGANPPGRFPVLFGDRQLFVLRFRAGPRPAFALPFGMFLDSAGKRVGRSEDRRGLDRFQPTKRAFLPNPTRGIEARQFLDAGLEVIAKDLGPYYTTLIDTWIRDARAQAGSGEAPPVVA